MAASFTSALTKAKKRRPLSSANPPPGTYSPQYDAQGREIQRGYDDLLQDFGIGKQRATDDLNLSLSQIGRGKTEALTDLATSRSRNLADLLTGRTRTEEDYGRAGAGLDRQYATLASQQGQTARRAHVEGEGILAQSLQARQTNRALDQQPLDISRTRALADSTSSEQRLGEDYATNVGRTNSDASDRSDALKLSFDRLFGAGGDNVLKVARSGRDLTAGQLDLSEGRWYDATANGYVPPTRPRRKRPVIV